MGKKVLVAGGAGFIGGHVVLELLEKKIEPIIFDNFSTSEKKKLLSDFIEGDLRSFSDINNAMKKIKPFAVINLASLSIVTESEKKPFSYYNNNICSSLNLINAMIQNNCKKLIFSSSASVYKNSKKKLTEDSPKVPQNSYGESKLLIEKIIKKAKKEFDIDFVIFRYFNASGADSFQRWGESHNPETHLIPLAIQAINRKKKLKIYGNSFKTKDGTAIRDYIHVSDIAKAHIKSIDFLKKKKSTICNLGVGKGYSVLEVVKTVEKITKKKVYFEFKERRKGEPEKLVCNPALAAKLLGWKAHSSNLEKIVQDAFYWYEKIK